MLLPTYYRAAGKSEGTNAPHVGQKEVLAAPGGGGS